MDATFNLDVSGWAHYNYGCASLHKGADGRLAHEFRPIAFALHRTERGDCYKRLMDKTKEFVALYLGMNISPTIVCIDHHAGAAAAITSTGAEVTLCWEHIARTAMQKTGQSKLVDRNFRVIADEHIKNLSMCRSHLQFEALLEITLSDWESKGEEDLANWFGSTYGTSCYSKWSVTASGIIGVPCSNQAIESYHRWEKRDVYETVKKTSHIPLGEFIVDVIPRKLTILGNMKCGMISSQRNPNDDYPREILFKANDLLKVSETLVTILLHP